MHGLGLLQKFGGPGGFGLFFGLGRDADFAFGEDGEHLGRTEKAVGGDGGELFL